MKLYMSKDPYTHTIYLNKHGTRYYKLSSNSDKVLIGKVKMKREGLVPLDFKKYNEKPGIPNWYKSIVFKYVLMNFIFKGLDL